MEKQMEKGKENNSESSEEFFSIQHTIPINVRALPASENLPSQSEFEQEIPTPFIIASESAAMESSALRNLRSLGDNNQDLINILTLQSKKIDMLMSYLLALQDDAQFRHQSTEFGASSLRYQSPKQLELGTQLQVKMFLHEESCAIYCYAQVERCDALSDGQFLLQAKYSRIREQDREILVRATLHIQSQQLKQRSEQLLEQAKITDK